MGKKARLKKERKARLQAAGIKKLPKGENVGTLDDLTDHIERFMRRLDQRVRHRMKRDITNPPMEALDPDSGPMETNEENRKMVASGTSCDGCTATKGCCYLAVSVTLFEMLPIARRLRAESRDTPELRKRLLEEGEEMENTQKIVWFSKCRPCIFLSEDEKCTIYNVRPRACRDHVVFTPAKDCTPFVDAPPRVMSYNTEPELYAATAWNKELCEGFMGLPTTADSGQMYAGAFPKVLGRVLEAMNTDDWRAALAKYSWPSIHEPAPME